MKPGDTFDRYTILRVIGRGGMGEVYRAQDTRLRRNVALKIVRASAVDAGDAKARAAHVDRLFREARAAAALEHPNVVVIHDVGEVTLEGATEPVCYIAMEYIQGTVLRAFVGQRDDVPFDARLRWLVDIARALAFAHDRGIIHRDVKPDNVILREDGVIKVLDFGIARRSQTLVGAAAAAFLPTLTETGPPMGTPRYMSPEQMLNERLDGRADQYSWALTAYELLGGAPPWSSTIDSVQLIAQVLTRAPEPLRTRAPHVPEDIARVIDRALSRERDERFPSMHDLLGALGVPTGPPTSDRRGFHQPLPEPTAPDVPTLAAQQSTSRGPYVKRSSRGMGWALLGGLAVLVAAGALVLRMNRPTPVLAVPVVVPEHCASAAACAERLGQPAVCRADNGACVKLASEDCRVSAAAGDDTNDATVWIGTLFPLTGDDAKGFGTREFQAVDLARADFAQMLAGANAREQGGRPLALLACDDAVDPHRALHHLVDEVGVPAVIGFRTSNEAIEAATSTLIPKGVMGVAALNTSPMISSLPRPRSSGSPRMVWRTTFSAAETALPIAQVIPGILEPELRAKVGAIGADGLLRVALLRQDDAAGIGFADVLFRNLRFNGRSALENEASYREFVYAPGSDAAKYDEVARNLVAFAPNVVIDFGGVEPFLAVVERVERAWHGASPPPRYLRAGTLAPSVVSFIGASTERRRRFLGLTSESTTATNARFVARYNEAFSDTVSRTFSPNSSYDAFYLVAYAALAIGDAPVTGASLSSAVPRLLPPGKPIDVGPSGILEAMNELSSGGTIDLNGATGRLDFNVDTGDAPVDLAVLCADVDAHGMASSVRESGLMYDATSGTLRGALHCP